MAKTTIYIASRTEQENYILQKKLEVLEYEIPEIQFASVHVAGLANAVDRLTAGVIMNLSDEWGPKEMILLQELRRAGYASPVLVMAKAESSTALEELRAMNGVTFLPKPFESKDLIGIVRKMALARQVPQQIHRRYATSQDAEIEMSGQKLSSRVRNLSKGGAYLEFLTPLTTKIGDFVQLKLELKDLNRTYTIPAKIVWTNRHGSRGFGIGVEFTGRGEMQRSIIGF